MIAVRTAIALIGGLLLLARIAVEGERRKPDGSPTLALAFALIGAAVFVVAVWT